MHNGGGNGSLELSNEGAKSTITFFCLSLSLFHYTLYKKNKTLQINVCNVLSSRDELNEIGNKDNNVDG